MTGFLTGRFSPPNSTEVPEHLEDQIYIELYKLGYDVKPTSIHISVISGTATLIFNNKQGNEELVVINDFSYRNSLSNSAKLQMKQKIGILIVLGVL